MSERDDGRSGAVGGGSPTDPDDDAENPPSVAVAELPRERMPPIAPDGDAPGPDDMVQAVVDFVDDLVEAPAAADTPTDGQADQPS